MRVYAKQAQPVTSAFGLHSVTEGNKKFQSFLLFTHSLGRCFLIHSRHRQISFVACGDNCEALSM